MLGGRRKDNFLSFPKSISAKWDANNIVQDLNSARRISQICSKVTTFSIAQSAGDVEYTNFISAEVYPANECPRYDTKQSDGEVPVMLELRRKRCTPSLPGPLWSGVVALDMSYLWFK